MFRGAEKELSLEKYLSTKVRQEDRVPLQTMVEILGDGLAKSSMHSAVLAVGDFMVISEEDVI